MSCWGSEWVNELVSEGMVSELVSELVSEWMVSELVGEWLTAPVVNYERNLVIGWMIDRLDFLLLLESLWWSDKMSGSR